MGLSLILSILLIHVSQHAYAHRFPPAPAAAPAPVADGPSGRMRCLTGYMTDVQRWVDENGCLTSSVESQSTIDLSAMADVLPHLYQQIQYFRGGKNRSVRYLSMARCKLNRVPTVFEVTDSQGRSLSETVEYITFYGNEFLDVSSPGHQYDMILNATKAREIDMDFGFKRPATSAWSIGFQQVMFSHLLQLDLRKCNIQVLSDYVFKGMPRLEALYIGENSITQISSNAFSGLTNLIHLDMSRNLEENDFDVLSFESTYTFKDLKRLESLDLSFSKITRKSIDNVQMLGKQFQRMSLCQTGLHRLPNFMFNSTSLKYLDLSGNSGILDGYNTLGGLEDKIQILYADEVGLKTFDVFEDFKHLEILKLSNNELSLLTPKIARSLTSLQVLDLSNNRMASWLIPTLFPMRQLRFLSLRENNINIISIDMINDFENISFVALSCNYIVCNCHSRELFEIALKNENRAYKEFIKSQREPIAKNIFNFHSGFEDFNGLIKTRTNVTRVCDEDMPCGDFTGELESDGNFLLIDYNTTNYRCLLVSDGKHVQFSSVQTCQQTKRDIDFGDVIGDSWNKLIALIIIPAVTFPVLIFSYVFRRNFKYCFITMRNSTLLSLINKKDAVADDTIFNYDVFVSYCNDDRNWVLDYLLPHVEKDCNVCVCLHERDFQVGLSILENIVSCMDRSRSIMLIISKKFLLSQWCQFEMHLAQHRLLETRREDLVLILLEDIPRRLRPTTLHYLMLTKTYIVWPKQESEQAVFWRRLKKSLVTYRLKQPDNVSLA